MNAGPPDLAEPLAGLDVVADLDLIARKMRVEGHDAVAVVDDDGTLVGTVRMQQVVEYLFPFVTCTVSDPSDAMSQRFSPPSRSDWKAIHSPSGEYRGWASKAMPEVSWEASPPVIGSVNRSPR